MTHTQQGPVDGSALRQVCAHFATGVTVITTGAPGDSAGTTVNSFTSVSLDPPLVLFCLHTRSRLLPLVRRSWGFVVIFLPRRQERLASSFAGRESARVEDITHDRSGGGLPILGEALAFLACCLRAEYEGGDHVILVGEVLELGAPGRHEDPLIF